MLNKYDHMGYDVMAQYPEEERKAVWEYNVKHRKMVADVGNWGIFDKGDGGRMLSVAKPKSGASNSLWGDKNWLLRCLRLGYMKENELTEYGRQYAGLEV